MPRVNPDDLIAAFGNPSPPTEMWEQAFDFPQEFLQRFTATSKQPVDDETLILYTCDLTYVRPLQPELLRYALPMFARRWYEELFEKRSSALAENFHGALASERDLVRRAVGERESQTLHAFMGGAILDRMDEENRLQVSQTERSAYQLFPFLGSYGTIWPDINALWGEWLQLASRGLAICALQYASCLMDDGDDNPVFPAWTPDKGGGPPSFWEFANVNLKGWLFENVDLFRSNITPSVVIDWAIRAAGMLSNSEFDATAQKIVGDLREREWRLEIRLTDLSRFLAKPHKGAHGWTA